MQSWKAKLFVLVKKKFSLKIPLLYQVNPRKIYGTKKQHNKKGYSSNIILKSTLQKNYVHRKNFKYKKWLGKTTYSCGYGGVSWVRFLESTLFSKNEDGANTVFIIVKWTTKSRVFLHELTLKRYSPLALSISPHGFTNSQSQIRILINWNVICFRAFLTPIYPYVLTKDFLLM